MRQLRLFVIMSLGVCSLVLPLANPLPAAAAALGRPDPAPIATHSTTATPTAPTHSPTPATHAAPTPTATPPRGSTKSATPPHTLHHKVAHLPTRQQAKQRRTSTPQGQAQPQISANSVVGAGDLTWNSGLVHENPVSYAIFWGPSWNDGAGNLTTDGQIPRNLLADVGGTSFASILTQYYDGATHLASSHTLAGVYLDFSTPPATDSCNGATIEDFDIQSEISRAITAQNWPSDRDNATYFVFTPNNYFTDDGNGFCSEQAYCAYHSWSPVANVAYAVLPYPTDLTSCGVPNTPNSNAAGDALANATSYELFGSATDPQAGTGWLDSLSYEIGEKCSYDFSAGTTTLAGGHTYELQTEYSNATSSCVTTSRPHLQLTPSTITRAVAPGATPAAQTLTLKNTGIAALTWSQTATLPNWLTLTPSAGTLAAGATQALTVTFAATSATPQTYTTTLQFADPAADNSPLSIPVTVSTAAHLQLQPGVVSLTTLPGASPAAQTLTLTNSGQATLNWSQTATLPSWLSLSPTSGSVAPGANQTLTLSFATPSTTPQAYTTMLTFDDPAADNAPVTALITVTSGYPHLQTTPSSIALKVGIGETPAPQIVTLTNTGVGPLTWTQTTALPSWLTLSASTGSLPMGAAQDLTLTFAPTGSSPQTYSTTLVFAGPNADNTPVSVPVTVQALPAKLPAPWLDQDIGSVGTTGSAKYAKGVFTVKGAGADIWGGADAFHYAYRPWSGNGAIVARVASLTNTDMYAKAGLMFRESLSPDAANVNLIATPSVNAFEWRGSTGAGSSNTTFSGTAPQWFKLARHDNIFTGFVSGDGVTWSQVGTITVPMASSIYVGLAVTSRNTSVLNTATFDNVSVAQTGTFQASPVAVYATTTPTGTPAAQTLTLSNPGTTTLNWQLSSTLPSWLTLSATSGTLAAGKSQTLTLTFATTGATEQTYRTALTFADPTADNSPYSVPVTVVASYTPIPAPPWAEMDIGGPGQAGSANYSNGTFTVQGSGADIWNNADQFHFVYQPLTGDGQIVAHVLSLTNTDSSAKAGVMMRESLDPTATNAYIDMTPTYVALQWRSVTANNSSYAPMGATTPYWVRLTRTGSTFTEYVSADGLTWIQGTTVTIPMATTIYVGLAVTSHNNNLINTATFDHVTVSTPPYGHLQATPTSVYITTAPGVSPAAQTLTLSNTGQGPLDWSVASTLPSWLAVTPSSGSLAVGATQPVTLSFTTTSTTPQQYITALALQAPNTDTLGLAIPVTVNSAPAVLNPSFEIPNLGNGYQYNPSGASWTFNGSSPSGSGLTGNGSAFTSGNPNAPSGTQVAFLQARGTITQDITNFQDSSYQVTFAAARRGNGSGGGNEDFQVFIDSTLIGTFTPASTLYSDLTTATFTTTAGTHTLKFVGVNSAGGDNTAFLDNVRIHLPYSHFQASPTTVYATVAPGGTPAPQTLTLTNSGQGTLNWSQIATLPSWLSVTPTSGSLAAGASQDLTLTFTATSTTPQAYNTTLTFIDTNSVPNTDNSPFGVAVTVSTNTQLPAPWADLDIGNPGQAGSANYSSGTFTVSGSGADIYGTSDQFHFVYQHLTGDGQIVARVASMGNTGQYAKAGVMIRETLDANAADVFTILTPASGMAAAVRPATGAATNNIVGSAGVAPYWLKLTRSGTTFSSAISPDGTTWTPLGTTTVAMATSVYIGLVVSAYNNGALNTATFDHVTVATPPYGHLQAVPPLININATPGATPAPQTLTFTNTGQASVNWSQQASLPSWLSIAPASGTLAAGASQTVTLTFAATSTTPQIYSTTLTFSDTTSTSTNSTIDNAPLMVPVRVVTNGSLPGTWADLDIGNTGQAGNASYNNSTFTVKGAGADIWGGADAFHYAYQSLTGDGQITAHVASLTNTDMYAKAGLMFRESLSADAANVNLIATPSLCAFEWRGSTGAGSSNTTFSGTAPQWFKLARHGNILTGFVSGDGVTWSQVGTITVPMASSIYVGLAVTSRNTSVLNTATFDNVIVATPPYGHLQAAPNLINVNAAPGATPAPQTLTFTNTGQASVNWSQLASLPSWLSVSPTSGTLAAGASQTITLTFGTTSTTPQIYSTTLTFSDTTSTNTGSNIDNAPLIVPVRVITNGNLPGTWADLDIGNPGQPGSAGYGNGTFTVSGSGADIFGTSDQFHFVYEPLTGDGQIVARVLSVQNTDTYAKVGVMMRASLDANAATAFTMVTAGAGLYANVRTNAGASMTNYGGPVGAAPYWVKVARAGNVFTSAVSPDGVTWTQITAQTLTMGTNIYIGMAVTAHNNAALNTSTVDNVTIVTPPYSHFQTSPSSVALGTAPGATPTSQTLTLTNSGQGTLNWSQSATLPSWLTVTPTSGTLAAGASQDLTLTFGATSTTPQNYSAMLTFSDTNSVPNANNSPFNVPVTVSTLPIPVNAGFETPGLGTGYQYNPSGATWTFIPLSGTNGSGIAGNGSAFTSGNPVAPAGTQVAFLQGQGTISQDVSNFQAGVGYQVSFATARRGNGGGNQDFQVLIDTTVLGTFTPTGTSYVTLVSPTFTVATAGTHTLKFVGLDSAGGDNTAFLDTVSILAVPAGPTSYTASSGFSPVQGQGQWGYRFSTDNEATFPAMTFYSGSAQWTANLGQDGYCLIGVNWQHPGTTCDSVRTWTAPSGGSVTITANGALSVAAPCSGNFNGVQVRVLKNGAQVWPASGWQVIPNGTSYTFPSGVSTPVAAGDLLQFVVQHVGGSNSCDTTIWDPGVTLTTP